MKWTKAELLRDLQNVDFDEDVVIKNDELKNDSGILSVEDVHVEGHGYIDDEDDHFPADPRAD